MDGTPDPYAIMADEAAEPLGVIYGNVGSVDINFAVTGAARKLDYVQCRHEEHGMLLGQIVDLFRETRLTYDSASVIGADGNDKEVKGRLSARVHLFGYTDEHGNLEAPLTPLNAGQHVYRAEDRFVKEVLGLRGRTAPGGIHLGKLKGHDIPVALDANTLIQRHASVIAKTGGGKSYMAGILVEGLLDVGVPVVIVDPHGEYGSLMHPNTDSGDLARMHHHGVRPGGYPEAVVEYAVDQELNVGALPLRFSERGMDPVTLLEMAGLKGSGPQLALLASAVEMLRAQGVRYSFQDVIEVLEGDRSGSRWNVINAIVGLQGAGIFSDHPTDLDALVRPGQCTVINLRGLGPDIANITVAMLLKTLFDGRKKGSIRPHMLVLEEAHTFCPQGGHTQARDIVRTVAAEGRKFGMGMAVITQRPAKVDKNVLSQCHTQMILKVTNPNDLRSVTAAAEGLTTRMGDEIQRLPVGVALVVGGSLAAPVLVEARPRRTKHGGRDIDVVADAQNGRPVPVPDAEEGMLGARLAGTTNGGAVVSGSAGASDGGPAFPPYQVRPPERRPGPGVPPGTPPPMPARPPLAGSPALPPEPAPEDPEGGPPLAGPPDGQFPAGGSPRPGLWLAGDDPGARSVGDPGLPGSSGSSSPPPTTPSSSPADDSGTTANGSGMGEDDVKRIGEELWDAIKVALTEKAAAGGGNGGGAKGDVAGGAAGASKGAGHEGYSGDEHAG